MIHVNRNRIVYDRIDPCERRAALDAQMPLLIVNSGNIQVHVQTGAVGTVGNKG